MWDCLKLSIQQFLIVPSLRGNFLGVPAVAHSRGLSSLISRLSIVGSVLRHKAKGNSFFLRYSSYMLSKAESVCFVGGKLLDDFLMLSPELTTWCTFCQDRKACKELISDWALSLFRKASLYEQLKPRVNFQSVEPMPVHTTLSASLVWVVFWHFPCLPSIKTLPNEAQNCNLSLALLVYFTSFYLEIRLIWEQLLSVLLQFLSTTPCFFKAYFGSFHKCFPVLVGWTAQFSASYQTWRIEG